MPLSRVDYEKPARKPKQRKQRAKKIAVEQAAAPSEPPVLPSEIELGFDGVSPYREEAEPLAAPPASPTAPPEANDVAPEADFQSRLDSVRGRIGNQAQGGEGWQPLLEQAISLLETFAVHPAIDDYASLKQRLDNVEQLLNSSGNVR